ncbi:MAG: tetratricopeptide repeat protein [Xenococcaceae cyanobacterium MO_188.B19]|nr:tetratricopeptide repeat protein [Xenococcaceae cyanobacterium MO_188.B19]
MNKVNQSTLQSSQIAVTIEKYTQMLAQNPEAPEIHFNLGNLYAQKEQWQNSIKHYRKAIKIDPQLTAAYRNIAKVYLKIGNEIEAANFWYKGVKLEPGEEKIEQYLGLGNTFRSQKQYGKAADCYRQAIQIKPDLISAYHALAKVFDSQGKHRQIISIYRQGIQKNQQNPEFHLALAQALAAQNKWEKASNRFRLALKLDSNIAIGYYHWGYVLSKREKWQQAKNCYQKAIEIKPEYWEAYYYLGLIFQKLEKWQKAKECYKKVTQINQEFVSGYLQLTLVYQKLGDYPLAIQCCNRALLISPEFSPLEEQAIAIYQKVLDNHPKINHNLYYQFGKLLRQKSRFEEAILAYQKTVTINPLFRSAHIDMQYTPIAPKQLPQHINFYRNVLEQNPQIDIAWGNLGDALTEENNIEEAINCYRKGCYQQVINTYPELAKLDWKEKKESAIDFIIIGAAKCGTSSLHGYLNNHPQILLPHKKELAFFSRRYDYGIDWYLAHFPSITDRDDFITGEATPNYIRFPISAERIKKHFPNIKLILLLRNPIDRTISWHYHKLSHGQLKADLETAILREIKNIEYFTEEEIVNSGYFKFDSIISSLYIYKIKSWLEIFDREQILILQSEDFYAKPGENMAKVYKFLGLPNQTLARYAKINSGFYNPADEKIRTILRDYFDPYNQQLEKYLGMKFNWS